MTPFLLSLVLLVVVIVEGGTHKGRTGKHSVAILEPHSQKAEGLDIPKHWGMVHNHQKKTTKSTLNQGAWLQMAEAHFSRDRGGE